MELKSITDESGRLSSGSKLRDEYLREMQQIQHEIGDLTQIRMTLGLSQRRLCRLLLVDPSAWTRWNKTGAPPHIYQALKWLIELKKINPEAVFSSNLESKMDSIHSNTQSKIKELEMNLEKVQHAVSMSVSHVSVLNQEARLQKEIESLKARIAELSTTSAIKSPAPQRKPKTKKKKAPIKILAKKPKKKAPLKKSSGKKMKKKPQLKKSPKKSAKKLQKKRVRGALR